MKPLNQFAKQKNKTKQNKKTTTTKNKKNKQQKQEARSLFWGLLLTICYHF